MSESVVVPVARRQHYTLSLQQSHGQTYVHCAVTRWTPAVARMLRADMDVVMSLHGGPIFATSHQPHGDDYAKWRKFVLFYGFKFFATVTTEDGVRHSVYVKER